MRSKISPGKYINKMTRGDRSLLWRANPRATPRTAAVMVTMFGTRQVGAAAARRVGGCATVAGSATREAETAVVTMMTSYCESLSTL